MAVNLLRYFIVILMMGLVDITLPLNGYANEGGKANIVAPSFLLRKAPSYPKSQAQRGHAGVVELSLMIDDEGNPFDVVVLRSSHQDFERSAKSAVKKYRYEPATQNSLPVFARSRVSVNYEIEGQLNQYSRKFYKWISKEAGNLSGENVEREIAKKAIKNAVRKAETRCDFAWLSLFQSQYSLKFDSTKDQIESLYETLMYDYDLEPDSRCFTDLHKSTLLDNLIRLLVLDERRGEVLFAIQFLSGQHKTALKEKFRSEIEQLLDSSPELNVIGLKQLEIKSNQAFVELFAPRFMVDLDPNLIKRLTLRCANGFRLLEKKHNEIYEVPNGLKSCQLGIEMSLVDQ